MSTLKGLRGHETAPASFIVALWAGVFRVLSYVSFFSLLRTMVPWLTQESRAYLVVETWVIGNTVLAAVSAWIVFSGADQIVVTILLVYGGLRVFEIVVAQANVLLFDEWRTRRAGGTYALRGYRRLLILLFHNYAEIVFWFVAALVTFNRWSWLALDQPSFGATLRGAFLSMVTFSAEGVHPLRTRAAAFLAVQSVVGVFMTVLTLARFVSLIPTPSTLESTER